MVENREDLEELLNKRKESGHLDTRIKELADELYKALLLIGYSEIRPTSLRELFDEAKEKLIARRKEGNQIVETLYAVLRRERDRGCTGVPYTKDPSEKEGALMDLALEDVMRIVDQNRGIHRLSKWPSLPRCVNIPERQGP